MESSCDTDIFLITSVINTGNNPWTYTNVRSVFSPDDRYSQTLNAIATIRGKCPAAKIILCDCSYISDAMNIALKEATDLYIQAYTNKEIHDSCIQSNKKGYGELLQTKHVVNHLVNNNIRFRRLFKISGRYFLNSSFNIDKFSTEEYSFREPFPNSSCNSTVLYSVPYNLITHFASAIERINIEINSDAFIMYEMSLPSQCNPKKIVNTCGVSGYVAIDGILYEDL